MTFRRIEKTTSAYSYPLLIKTLLRTPMVYSPKQEIVYRDKFRFDYLTLGKRISQLANALADIGVGPGNTVAVMDWDSHRYLECYFAVPMMGAVLHTINIRLTPEQLIYTINHAEDDVILVNSEFLPMVEKVKDQLETVKKIVLLLDDAQEQDSSLSFEGEYEALLKKSSDHYDFPDFDEDTVASMFYTTGTTGLPKGVYYTHRQVVLHAFGVYTAFSGFVSQCHLNSGDVYMPITPMFHVNAWGCPYVFTMLGAKQVYAGRYEPEMLLKLIHEEKVTFSHCVPTILQMLFNCPKIKETNLTNWQVVTGGSVLPKVLCKAALDLGINVYAGYGMSETGPLLTITKLKPEMMEWGKDKEIDIRCRTGLPAPLVDIKIIDNAGNPLPHDAKSTGEIVARAPWLTQGYLKDAEKSEDLWADGWLHTGDIGWIDENNYLQITDRIKDVIKTGGEWISSLELEDIISHHPAVSEVAVIGMPDQKWGERPFAVVVLKEEFEGKIDEDELKNFFMELHAAGTIPKYWVPERIAFTNVITKTSVGKVDKKELRRAYGC